MKTLDASGLTDVGYTNFLVYLIAGDVRIFDDSWTAILLFLYGMVPTALQTKHFPLN